MHLKNRLCKKKIGPDRGGLVTDRKARFAQSRWHILNADSHTDTHTITHFFLYFV